MKRKKQKFIVENEKTTTNRSEYIRYEFIKGKSRSEIAKELKVSYQIVANATTGMDNGTIKHKNNNNILIRRGLGYINRIDYIREQILIKKRKVKDVAKELNIAISTVYYALRK